MFDCRRIVIGLLMLVLFVGAQTEDTKLAGKGELTANGSGLAILGGAGWFKISGTGCLWYSGDAELITTGDVGKETIGKWTFIANFNGTAEAKGKELRVSLSGKNIVLNAKGQGKALLWGTGTFSSHGKSGAWSLKYNPIPYTEGPKQKVKVKQAGTEAEGE